MKSKHMLRAAWVTVWLVSLLVGCSVLPTPPPDPTQQAQAEQTATAQMQASLALAFTSWQVESYGGPDPEEMLLADPDAPATVNFFLTRYAGFGGCNWFLGVYDVTGTELFMRTPSQTRVFCDRATQEGTFITALLNVVEYRLEDDKLIGYTRNSQPLITLVPGTTIPLEGATWNLAFTASNGRSPVPLIFGTAITAEFTEDEISGDTGCNTFSAAFERGSNAVESDRAFSGEVTLGEINMVVRNAPCSEPRGILDQEQRFLAALQSVTSIRHLGSTLIMFDADDQAVLAFGAGASTE